MLVTQPQREGDFQFSGGALSIPDEVVNKGTPTTVHPATTSTGGVELSQAEKDRLADEEIKRRAAGGRVDPPSPGKPDPTKPAGTEGKDEPTETPEQIQAKLDELAKKEDKDLTEDDLAYIDKYAPQEDTVTQTRNFLAEKYSLEVDDTKKYEDSPEGIAVLMDDLAPKIAEQMLIEHFDRIPKMRDLYDHLSQGRSIETFLVKAQKPAFEQIVLKDDSTETDEAVQKQLREGQKQIIRQFYSSKGVPDADIQLLIDTAEAGGYLYTKAVAAKAELVTSHKISVEAQLKAEEKRIEAAEQQQIQIAKAVEKMIEKNDFDGLSIHPAELRAFKDALFNVDGQGKSIIDYKRTQLTLGQQMYINYLVFKGFKIPTYQKPAEQITRFRFSKGKEDNNSRNGGRLRGGSANAGGGAAGFDNLPDFFNSRMIQGTTKAT